jgi:hypothetical protein
MAGPPRSPDTGDDIGVGPGLGSPPRMPRWVKVSGIIVATLVLLVVIAKTTGLGGSHGPGRHIGTGAAPSAGVTAVQLLSGGNPGDYPGDHTPPERGF